VVQLTVIIPTHNRPKLLPIAVRSALEQTYRDLEVLVVDDASTQFPPLPDDPRLRVLHLPENQGGAAARNAGTQAANGRWITYLDDDDILLPTMAERAIAQLEQTAAAIAAGQHPDLQLPLGVLSGLAKVTPDGEVLDTRLPPDFCPKGQAFFLGPQQPGRSFLTKQTLIVERETILAIGGWDEQFRSRVHSELFLRLNRHCSLIGIPEVGYRLRSHRGDRVSGNPALRQESFHRLLEKHGDSFRAHPQRYADFVYDHARTSWRQRKHGAALQAVAHSVAIAPRQAAQRLSQSLVRSLPFA